MRKKTAFSLIELSIVIIVIGILIAGVTQGSKMVDKARIKTAQNLTLSSEVNGIKDIVFWFETSMQESFGQTLLEDEDTVTTWSDINPQSQLKFDLTQTTSANRPTYEEDSQNHLPGLVFDGTNDNLTFASGTDFSHMKNQDFFYVVKWVSNGTYSTILSQYDNTSGERSYFYRFANGKPGIGNGAYGLELSTSPQTDVRIYNGYITPSEWGMSNDAQTFETKSVTTIASTDGETPKIGIRSDDIQIFKGTIYEMILFARKLKNSEREAVREYLKNKWSI